MQLGNIAVSRNFSVLCTNFREKPAKFEISGVGTNKGADNKNITAKSVNILISVTSLRSVWQ